MYQQESIYNLIPKEKIEPPKTVRHRSLYPHDIAPTATTFGLLTSSFPKGANMAGDINLPRGAHPTKGLYSTFGKPNGFNKADPENFIKKGHQYKVQPARNITPLISS
jgi:hypothetical protein